MRGAESTQRQLFSLVDLEQRIPTEHPIRAFKALVEPILRELSPAFDALYADSGRTSIPPEQLLRALLLQVLYTVRSERQVMEQLDFNLLFRWFVGLRIDEPVWHPTSFTKNRDRLLDGDIASAFMAGVARRSVWKPNLFHGPSPCLGFEAERPRHSSSSSSGLWRSRFLCQTPSPRRRRCPHPSSTSHSFRRSRSLRL